MGGPPRGSPGWWRPSALCQGKPGGRGCEGQRGEVGTFIPDLQMERLRSREEEAALTLQLKFFLQQWHHFSHAYTLISVTPPPSHFHTLSPQDKSSRPGFMLWRDLSPSYTWYKPQCSHLSDGR